MRVAAWTLLGAAVVGLAGCDSIFGNDDKDNNDNDHGAVYTMTNVAGANRVLIFARAADGTLTLSDSIATGGSGSGPDPVFGTDPLASQDAVILSGDSRFLFVVNAGSNEISSFRVGRNGALTLASKVSSGGTFPVSLAQRGTLLYVVNAKNGGNISGFRIGTDGALTAIAGSTKPLSGAADPGPGSIRINPAGTVVVVTEKPTNKLDVYTLAADGTPAGPTVVASTGPTPFGADFDATGNYVVSIGNIGPNRAAVPDGSSASSLRFATSGTPTVVSANVPTTETAACWVQISGDNRFAYTTNTGSGTITGFTLGSGGVLTLLTPSGQTAVTGPNTQPLDMAYIDSYLYALTAGDRGIHVFRASLDGSLSPVSQVTGVLPVSVTGLAAF